MMFLSESRDCKSIAHFGKAKTASRVHVEFRQALQMLTSRIRTSLRTSVKGSVSLEAALVMPLIIFIMYAFLMIGQMLVASEEIDKGLNETARYLAKDAYGSEDYHPSILSSLRIRDYIDQSKVSVVANGVNGIAVRSSVDDKDSIKLDAIYRFHISLPFYGNYCYTVKDTASARMFNGWDKDRGFDSDEYVYVAETGSVYHTDLNCRYISVHLTDAHDVSLVGKRHCKLCSNHSNNGRYVTVCGDCIHKDINCSTLKRTIHLVRKKDLKGLPLCSNCAKGG